MKTFEILQVDLLLSFSFKMDKLWILTHKETIYVTTQYTHIPYLIPLI